MSAFDPKRTLSALSEGWTSDMVGTMGVSPITFENALEETAKVRRHLLLGKGFSIAAHPGFSYQSLREKAVEVSPSIEPLLPQGVDFETAMRQSPEQSARLRHAFIEAVAHIHPTGSYELAVEQRRSCADFLAKFLRRRTKFEGRVFTTNYDLTLYWVGS